MTMVEEEEAGKVVFLIILILAFVLGAVVMSCEYEQNPAKIDPVGEHP